MRPKVPCRECAPRTGLEVTLEARSTRFVRELDRDDHAPGTVLKRIASRSCVVPFKAPVDIRRTADVVPGWVAFTAKDVHEPRANALHVDRSGIIRASEICQLISGGTLENDAEVRRC